MSLQSKLTKGDQVLFQVWNGKPLTLYFDKPFNEKQGFFKDEQQGGPYRKDYKNIIKINGRAINEIKVNNPIKINLKFTHLMSPRMKVYSIDDNRLPNYGTLWLDNDSIFKWEFRGLKQKEKVVSILDKLKIPYKIIYEKVLLIEPKHFQYEKEIQEIKINKPNQLVIGKKYDIWNNSAQKWYRGYNYDGIAKTSPPNKFYKFKKGGAYMHLVSLGDEKDIKPTENIQEIKINKPLSPKNVYEKYELACDIDGSNIFNILNQFNFYNSGTTVDKFLNNLNINKLKKIDLDLSKIINKTNLQEMKLQQILNEEIDNIIQQQRQEVLTFEENPIEYILQKYPSLNETLIDLLTTEFRDYITGLFIMAPKPTIFKVLLHNGQFFYLTYTTDGYTAKIAGKQYALVNIKEQEYAIKSISNLLMMGMPPSSEGPGEETENQADMKDQFATDMTSEPGGDLDLDGIDSEPEVDPDAAPEEGEEEEEPITEKKIPTKFRIIS